MIPVSEPYLGKEELENVVQCVKTGWISSQGAFVRQFEDEFASYVGVRYGVATSSGTTALHLALVALGIKGGDEVIVPTLTFVATANVVAYTGATPVFIDSNPQYWCIEPERIEKAITPKTKVIIPVHLYGHPADMEAIMGIALKYGLHIIEDAAEAHGAKYKGRMIGSLSTISCFSFYANKIITTGEGGMCLTNNKSLAEKMRLLRDHGMNPTRRYWHNCIGFNYRMTNLQAAVGVAQLHKIDGIIKIRSEIAKRYNAKLDNLGITLPPKEDWAEPINWIYTILSSNKEGIIDALTKNGVDTRPMFYPIHILPPYQSDNKYPVAEGLSSKGFSLPSSPSLTNKDIDYICGVIGENSLSTS